MNLSRYWPLAILLLGMGGCNGTSPASAGKSAAELIESGKTALARGETDQALADFGAAVDAQPDSALARERRADAFLRMKKFDQVLYDCAEALKIDAKFAAAYFTRGVAEKDLGETGKALEDFTKALDNGFAPVDVLTARGTLYHSMAKLSATPDDAAKMLAAALKDLDGAVKLDPRRTDCRLQRGLVHLDMGDYAAAVADCDEALKADSDLAGAYLARARGECELSEFEHSIRDCDSALHQDEKLFEAHVIRAKRGWRNRRRCERLPRSPSVVVRWTIARRRSTSRRSSRAMRKARNMPSRYGARRTNCEARSIRICAP